MGGKLSAEAEDALGDSASRKDVIRVDRRNNELPRIEVGRFEHVEGHFGPKAVIDDVDVTVVLGLDEPRRNAQMVKARTSSW